MRLWSVIVICGLLLLDGCGKSSSPNPMPEQAQQIDDCD
jgi:hypothetical protein